MKNPIDKIHEANNPITTIASVGIDMTMDIAKYLIKLPFKPFTKKDESKKRNNRKIQQDSN